MLVRQWGAVEHVLNTRPNGPWYYVINNNGLREIPLG